MPRNANCKPKHNHVCVVTSIVERESMQLQLQVVTRAAVCYQKTLDCFGTQAIEMLAALHELHHQLLMSHFTQIKCQLMCNIK